jgi:hypothetical protein
MKRNIRDDLKDKRLKGLTNRPGLVDKRPKGVLFSTEGSSWWDRVGDIRLHKGNKNKGDFSHRHDKFWSEDTPVSEQLERLSKDVPELFTMPRGAGSRGSLTPVLKPEDEPLTREQVEKMSEQEINSNWQRVKAFMAGERG